MRSLIIFLVGLLLYTENAVAYVGPGLGLGAIGALIGIVVTVILAVLGLLWYPVKRLYFRMRSKIRHSHSDDK
jgi:hypothetical protein